MGLGRFRRSCMALLFACMAACQSAPGNISTNADGPARPADRIDTRIWFEAADAGDAGILAAMLDDGMDPRIERNGLTALHIAASGGHVDAVRLLVETGMDVNLGPDGTDARIAEATGYGNPHMLSLLFGQEPAPEAVARAGSLRTPLNLAVENGHEDVAAVLIGAGADVNAGGEWYSPLCSAILFGDSALVELLLENGARANDVVRIQDPSVFAGFRYARPLDVARIIEREDLVTILQTYGAR